MPTLDPVTDEVVGRYIEITRTPEILRSQDADIQAGRAQLVFVLSEDQADAAIASLNKAIELTDELTDELRIGDLIVRV